MVEPAVMQATSGQATGPVGKPRNIAIAVLLAVVTFGIYAYVWTCLTHGEMKRYTGRGVGGILGLVVFIFVAPVTYFLIPVEIKNMLEAEGHPSPVGGAWGFWFLLPLIGTLIWFFKMQGTLNGFWVSKGAPAP